MAKLIAFPGKEGKPSDQGEAEVEMTLNIPPPKHPLRGVEIRPLDSVEHELKKVVPFLRLVKCPTCSSLIGEKDLRRDLYHVALSNGGPPGILPFSCPKCSSVWLIQQDQAPGIAFRIEE